MPSPRQQRGFEAEDQAADFLLAKGWTILDRHVTSRYGEIDILAQDGEIIVAVEVKARQNKKFGTAAESVTQQKLQRLRDTLADILEKRGWSNRLHRIDVVAFDASKVSHLESVE